MKPRAGGNLADVPRSIRDSYTKQMAGVSAGSTPTQQAAPEAAPAQDVTPAPLPSDATASHDVDSRAGSSSPAGAVDDAGSATAAPEGAASSLPGAGGVSAKAETTPREEAADRRTAASPASSAPAPGESADELRARVAELETRNGQLEAIGRLVANDPKLKRAVFEAAAAYDPNAAGPVARQAFAARLPENFDELSAVEQGEAVVALASARTRETIRQEVMGEVEALRTQIEAKAQYQELLEAYPNEGERLSIGGKGRAPSPEMRKALAYHARFDNLPRNQRPTLTEAYEAVMAPVWAKEIREHRNTAGQAAAVARRSAATVQRPGASPGAEVRVDVRKAPTDRDAFRFAALEAERQLRLT